MIDWKNESGKSLVCYCHNVDKQTIVDAIADGCCSLEEIKEKTTACTGGNCKVFNPNNRCCGRDILKLIEIYANPSDYRKE